MTNQELRIEAEKQVGADCEKRKIAAIKSRLIDILVFKGRLEKGEADLIKVQETDVLEFIEGHRL